MCLKSCKKVVNFNGVNMGKFKSIGGRYKGVEEYKKNNGTISYYIRYKDIDNRVKRDKVGESPGL